MYPCWLIYIVFYIIWITFSSAYDITPPQIRSDWVLLSKLMVNCLVISPVNKSSTDDVTTTTTTTTTTTSISNLLENFQWKLYQESISRRQIYQQLVRTANSMQDMKYTIIIAKERQSDGRGKVIGMIELGVSMSNSRGTTTSSKHSPDDQQQQERRVMVGTICVDPQYRNLGIASKLMDTCERIAIQQWKETEIYAHIEETNDTAIKFFSKLGYSNVQHMNNNDTPSDLIRVRRRCTVEIVPHLLYKKNIQHQLSNDDTKPPS